MSQKSDLPGMPLVIGLLVAILVCVSPWGYFLAKGGGLNPWLGVLIAWAAVAALLYFTRRQRLRNTRSDGVDPLGNRYTGDD